MRKFNLTSGISVIKIRARVAQLKFTFGASKRVERTKRFHYNVRTFEIKFRKLAISSLFQQRNYLLRFNRDVLSSNHTTTVCGRTNE